VYKNLDKLVKIKQNAAFAPLLSEKSIESINFLNNNQVKIMEIITVLEKFEKPLLHFQVSTPNLIIKKLNF
jgi:hypothetical protein